MANILEKKEIISLFANEMIVYIGIHSYSIYKNTSGAISEFSKIVIQRSTCKNRLHLCILTMFMWKLKFGKEYHMYLCK